MKKKSVSYFIVGLLLLSSLAIVGMGKEAGVLGGIYSKVGSPSDVKTISVCFLEPEETEISIDGETYVELEVEGANTVLHRGGEPMLPIYVTTLSFTFGTKILDVECTMDEVETKVLSHEVVPAPHPVPVALYVEGEANYVKSKVIYNSGDLFPDTWVTHYTGGGIEPGTHEQKTYCTVIAYPVRYSPASNIIKYMEGDVEITVTYEEPMNPMTFGDDYDMVVIAPSEFSDELQELVSHKNDRGVSTILKTTEDIYSTYPGVDKPEQIKYFIKDALDTWGIKYVLLVGGLNSLLNGVARDDTNQGTQDWWLPVRYTNLRDSGPTYDPGYISDLYYADIYNSTGAFDDWDSNDDGIFANWGNVMGGKDVIDHYPDVFVGRLPCRNTKEVEIMVSKIVNYETGAVGAWYNKMILIAGDSHDDVPYGTNYNEGEVVCELTWERHMDEFTPVRVYASNKGTGDPVPTPGDIIWELGSFLFGGAGHLLFEGHGNPAVWNTHWAGAAKPDDPWTGGIQILHFPLLRNDGKLPVCIVGGCHNSQFNVSALTTWRDKNNSHHMWCHGMIVPECWSWWLARKIGGGTIATMGNTALGYGAIAENGDLDGDGINDPDTFEWLGGYQSRMFYKTFDDGIDILGECWGGSVTAYCQVFPPMDYQTDAKSVQQWALIGDPSLKIGGYSNGGGVVAKIAGADAGFIVNLGETIMLEGMASNGQGEYTFEWDFDNDGEYDDATGQTVTWEWYQPGVHGVSLKATDSLGEVDTYNTVVKVEPAVSTPDMSKGETNVDTYTYTVDMDETSAYWNKVYYKYDWGDGTESDWVGPYAHDEEVKVSHSWEETGSYDVKVIALLTHDVLGAFEDVKFTDWSSPLTTSVKQQLNNQKSTNPLFFQILERLLPRLR